MPTVAPRKRNHDIPILTNEFTMKRFELPALSFSFGSLTDGTDIPPPPPSPIHEEAPKQPKTPTLPATTEAKAQNGTNGVSASSTGTQTTPESLKNGVRRSVEDPVSPASSNRRDSIRRLFSSNLLSTTYANGGVATGESSGNGLGYIQKSDSRPTSRSTSIATEKQSKRASGWFRRLRGDHSADHLSSNGSVEKQHTNKRMSRMSMLDEDETIVSFVSVTPAGPPAPKIPEFNHLGSKVDLTDDGGSLGSDLFKNIK